MAVAAAAAAASMAVQGVGIEALIAWHREPALMVRELFAATPDGWQAKVLDDFGAGARRLCMKACKNPGKTTVDSWLAWNFLLTRPDPKVIATSITGPNLDDGLWSEMAKWQKRSPLLTKLFEWSRNAIVLRSSPETHFMVARRWSRDANPEQQGEALAGKHADYLLFLLDEAGGIPDAVATTAEAALGSGVDTRIVLSGNPTELEGPLYRACETGARRLWKVHEITGDPDREDRAPRVSLEWARDTVAEWGRDSNFVRVNVLGQFPSSAASTLISPEDVRRAMARDPRTESYQDSARVLGVDVAREGDDRSVIGLRHGLVLYAPRILRDLAPHGLMTLASQVAAVVENRDPDATFIDATGLGAGVYDRCMELNVPRVFGINFGAGASEKQYRNKRTEMWFRLAADIKQRLALPHMPELPNELGAVRYRVGVDGRLELEAKADIKKRLGYSPDIGDMAALTYADTVVARAVRESEDFRIITANEQHGHWDYNPLDAVRERR